jgi:hypothetical protein
LERANDRAGNLQSVGGHLVANTPSGIMRFFLLIGGLVGSLLLGCVPAAWAQATSTLSPMQLQRLAAFARLAGSVRYFYPSPPTNRADWPAFYHRCIPQILQAPTPPAYADTLRRAFAAIAPAVQVSRSADGRLQASTRPAGVVYHWEHRGLTLEQQGLGIAPLLMRLAHLPFASRLRVDSARLAQPAAYTVLLGDSLAATVPLLLPQAQALAPIGFRRHARRFQIAQQPQRLAVVMQTWNVLQQFYPYRTQLARAHWDDALPAALLAADAARTDAALLAVCQRMVAQLGDRHVQVSRLTRTGLYVTPPPFALGFELLPDGQPVVARAQGPWGSVFPVGSVLEQVNGQPVGPLLDSLQLEISARSSQVARQLAVQQLLAIFWRRGPTVEIAVRTNSTLHRQRVAFRKLRVPDARAQAYKQLPDSLMYLNAAHFQYAEFLRQLPALQRARGLIVDLRQRPAYGLQQALAHWANGPVRGDWLAMPVLHAPDFAFVTYDSVASTTAARLPHLATRTVFLIGPNTFSYGETIAELVRHYQLGTLLGEPTGGTNGEMNFASIGRHFRLSWTGRAVRNRDDRPYQGQGIAPDIEAHSTMSTIQSQQDAALQQAVACLLHASAAAGRRP